MLFVRATRARATARIVLRSCSLCPSGGSYRAWHAVQTPGQPLCDWRIINSSYAGKNGSAMAQIASNKPWLPIVLIPARRPDKQITIYKRKPTCIFAGRHLCIGFRALERLGQSESATQFERLKQLQKRAKKARPQESQSAIEDPRVSSRC